jgi:hypothetical protein
MPYEIQTALIAGAVALAGTTVSVLVTRTQLANERRKLRHEVEFVRQGLQKEVLDRRLAAYAAVWKVMISYDLNWVLENRPLDREWADSFLKTLNECNAEHGVLFAEPVYQRFTEYRACVLELRRRTGEGEILKEQDLNALIRVSAGTKERSGLGTELKDGLGAYLPTYLEARSVEPAA